MNPDIEAQLRALGINPDSLAGASSEPAHEEAALFAGSEPAPATSEPTTVPVVSPSQDIKDVATADAGLPSVAELTARIIRLEAALLRQGMI